MIEFYIGFTVLLVAIIGMLVLRKSAKKKKAEQERKDAAWQQLKEMRDSKYKLMRAEESERSRLRANYQTSIPDVTIAKMQSIRSSSRSVTPSSTIAPAQPVYDSSSDLLTNMIILNSLASHSDTTAGTVSWKDDTPTITPVAASSYSAPEPEPERSSYTSSYSSSSSDSSYSSSSSDSSYSSSSSDSSSSYSSD